MVPLPLIEALGDSARQNGRQHLSPVPFRIMLVTIDLELFDCFAHTVGDDVFAKRLAAQSSSQAEDFLGSARSAGNRGTDRRDLAVLPFSNDRSRSDRIITVPARYLNET